MNRTKRQFSENLKIAVPLPKLSLHKLGSSTSQDRLKRQLNPLQNVQICTPLDDAHQKQAPFTPRLANNSKLNSKRSVSSPKIRQHLPKIIQSQRNLQIIMSHSPDHATLSGLYPCYSTQLQTALLSYRRAEAERSQSIKENRNLLQNRKGSSARIGITTLCQGRLGKLVDELMRFQGKCASPLLRKHAHKLAVSGETYSDAAKANASSSQDQKYWSQVLISEISVIEQTTDEELRCVLDTLRSRNEQA